MYGPFATFGACCKDVIRVVAIIVDSSATARPSPTPGRARKASPAPRAVRISESWKPVFCSGSISVINGSMISDA